MKRFSRAWFLNQLKLNSVAIVSLLTAIFSFSYNTWQDHQDEINQNMRVAAFEMLQNLGELQTVVNYAHFADDKARGHPIDGWKHVSMIQDLSHFLSPEATQQSEALSQEWAQNWEKLDQNDQAETRISAQISKTRLAVLKTIDKLE